MGKYHRTFRGECFSSLAHQYGFENYLTIYNHPENADLVNCVTTESKGITSPDETPEIIFTAQNYCKEVGGSQSVEVTMKKNRRFVPEKSSDCPAQSKLSAVAKLIWKLNATNGQAADRKK